MAGILGGILGCVLGGWVAAPPAKPKSGDLLQDAADSLGGLNRINDFVASMVAGGALGAAGGAVLGARYFGEPRA